jgi:large repetitive protein
MLKLKQVSQTLFALFVLIFLPQIANAQLEMTKQVDSATVLSGNQFTYTLQYRCASIVSNCANVVVFDTIPSGLGIISTIGTPHTVNNGTVMGNNVRFDFVNPLPAGSTGDLKIVVTYPNGATPNGTTLSNRAWISDRLTKTPSNTVSTTAIVVNRVTPTKTLISGGTVGSPSTYQIRTCVSNPNEYYVSAGTLNATDLTITDQLPAGATILSISDGGTSDASGLITWNVPNGSVVVGVSNTNTCINRTVTVQYNAPAFKVGDIVTNTAQTVHTPLGSSTPITTVDGSQVGGTSIDLKEITPLIVPNYGATISKTAGTTALKSGQSSYYNLDWRNTGNVPLANFFVEDSIPDEIKITHFGTGNWSLINYATYNIYYQTNLNSTYTLWTGSPFPSEQDLYPQNLGLATGERLTKIKFDFGSFPAGASVPNIYVFYMAQDVAVNTLTTNKLTYSTTSPITGTKTATASVTIEPRPDFSIPQPFKDFYKSPTAYDYLYGTPKSVGDTVWVNLTMQVSSGGQPITDPTLVDLLPLGLTYDGAWQRGGDYLGLGAPVFTRIPNYNGSGRELIKFKWTGTPTNIDNTANVLFRTKVTNLSTFPSMSNYLSLYGANSMGCIDPNIYVADDGFVLDIYDLNGNGSTMDSICQVKATININPSAAVESGKLARGSLDVDYTRYPATGSTVPGGYADYKIYLKNTGNVPMKNIEIVDILPFIGDKGVIDTLARLSDWRPNLAGGITAPAGVTVYYSQSANPCRPNLVPSGPVGCEVPNWTTTLPSDITTVQSLRFDFGTTVLQPNQQFEFTWPMRAPISTLPNGATAWNSLAFSGTRTDNNSPLLPAEPVKVGIKIVPTVPAAYGNYVWLDTNRNGLQDETNTGVNGVRIELYKDNGDGVSNPATDTLYRFTVTGNGGYYEFPNLPSGDYYAVVYPPTTFTISPANNATDLTDLLDSDGISGTFDGVPVAIFPVTYLDVTEIDHSWDLGIFCAVPVFRAAAIPSLCNGAIAANNGRLIVQDVSSADRFAVSNGLIFNGLPYELATPITNVASQTVLNNLPASATPSVYTIRLYNGQTGCYQDATVTLPSVICDVCRPICLPVSVTKN